MKEKFSSETLFDEMNKCHVTGNHRTAIIVFKESNWDEPYLLESRSYASHSDQWGWDYSKAGRCRLADSLDGTDQVRLDYYDWEIDYWYWQDDNR